MTKHLISIDYEDWYTTSHYKNVSNKHISLIEKPTYQILDLLDATQTKSTFFILGSIAEKKPHLILEIYNRGHEIASHGYSHTPLDLITPKLYRKELITTNSILENITQKKILGHRAPFFSLTQNTSWLIDILTELDFKYDSSIFPMPIRSYGVSNGILNPYKISSSNINCHHSDSPIWEIPASIFSIGKIRMPFIGGIYSRFLPFFLFKLVISKANSNPPINFYFHPWELINKIDYSIESTHLKNILANYNSKKYLNKIEWMLQNYPYTNFRQFLNL